MSNFINDRLRAGFDHDESGENSVENNIKDYLNTAWSNNKGSLNDGLFNEAGTSGTEQNGLILNINDRLKNYFGATNINDGIKAGFEWERMLLSDLDNSEKEKIKQNLFDYCNQDTLATYKLLMFLQNLLVKESMLIKCQPN